MSDEDEQKQLRETIAELEKFHQAMPEDRQTLEILAVAYGKVGDADGQVRALADLAGVLIRQKDLEHAGIIAENLRAFPDNPAAAAAAAKVAEALAAAGQGSSSAAPAAPALRPGAKVEGSEALDIWTSTATAAEADIVWHWKDHKVIPDEVCMELLHVLMDSPAPRTAPRKAWLVSALGVLEERHAELTDIAFGAQCKRSKLVPVPVDLLDPARDAVAMLPEDYIRIKGVLPFAKIGGELLVAVMNGVNADLRAEIREMAGVPCHFYLMNPRAWNAASVALFGDDSKVQ